MIPAGGSGKLTAKVNTDPLKSGRLTKSVSVLTDAPGEEYLRLSVSFTAVAPITVLPRARLRISTVEGETATARVALRRTDGKPLEMTGFTHDLPFEVEVRSEPVTEAVDLQRGTSARPGDLWLQVSVTPPEMELRRTGRLTISTNHPKAARLTLPVAVFVESVIDVRPARVNLLVSDLPNSRTEVAVRLSHGQRVGFEVTGIEVSHPDLFSANLVTNSERPYHVIRVALAGDIDPETIQGAATGSVRIHSSEPRKPVVEIPVVVQRHESRQRRMSPLATPTVTELEADAELTGR